MKKIIFLLLVLNIASVAYGQSENEKKYFKENYADTIKDESIVIVRNFEEYKITKHNILDYKINVVLRTQYKLKDFSAIEAFSTLSKTNGLKKIFISQIKPDGKVKEIYINEEKDYNEEREQYSVKLNEGNDKIAVEDLEIGDVIDYRYEYTYTTTASPLTPEKHFNNLLYNYRFKNYNIFRKLPSFTEFLQQKYPSLSSLYIVDVPNELKLLQKALNCNYKFSESKANGNKSYKCKLGFFKSYKSEFFSYAYVDLPVLKFCVVNTANEKMQNLYAYQFLDEDIQTSDIAALGRSFYMNKKFMPHYLYFVDTRYDVKGYAEVSLNKFFSKFIKTFAKDNSDKLDVLNKFHEYISNNDEFNIWQFDKMNAAVLMARFCDKIKQPYKMMACLHRYDGTWNEVIHPSEINWGIYIQNDGNDLFITSMESSGNIYEKLGSLAGTEAIVFNTLDLSDPEKIIYPTTDFKDNKMVLESEIKFSDIRKNFDYHFVNTYTHTGGQKKNIDDNIAYQFYPEKLTTNPRFQGIVSYRLYNDDIYKDSNDYMPEFRRISASYHKKFDDNAKYNFENFLYSEYHFRKISIDSFRIIKGEGYTDDDQSENVFKVEFNAENVLENTSGGNLILKLGRLITEQTEISNFKNDIRMTTINFTNKREIDWDISIDIPEGYQPVNLNDFNQKFENITGSFNTTVTQKGNKLILKVEKIYKTNHLDKEQWNEVAGFLKQAVLFYERKLILEKK